jgi:hypothetical protein
MAATKRYAAQAIRRRRDHASVTLYEVSIAEDRTIAGVVAVSPDAPAAAAPKALSPLLKTPEAALDRVVRKLRARAEIALTDERGRLDRFIAFGGQAASARIAAAKALSLYHAGRPEDLCPTS